MLTVIAIIHLLVSVALIFVVLLQTGRGSDIGAAFGSGASQTLFGSSGSTGFMTKLTTAAVVIFMLTSLLLAYFYSHREYRGEGSIQPDGRKAAADQSYGHTTCAGAGAREIASHGNLSSEHGEREGATGYPRSGCPIDCQMPKWWKW